MTRDRTGEIIDNESGCPHRCRKGWLTPPNSDAPTPCPRCKKELADKLRRGRASDVNTLRPETEYRN